MQARAIKGLSGKGIKYVCDGEIYFYIGLLSQKINGLPCKNEEERDRWGKDDTVE